jgi:hypothetical protein
MIGDSLFNIDLQDRGKRFVLLSNPGSGLNVSKKFQDARRSPSMLSWVSPSSWAA